MALERSQAALLTGDVAALELHTAEQSRCCERLSGLPGRGLLHHCQNREPEESDSDITALAVEIEQVRMRVRSLNRVHAALLRRASRSLQILQNLTAASALTYASPASKGE
jgi:hypothetical protein